MHSNVNERSVENPDLPSVGIVIVSFNVREHLLKCLDGLQPPNQIPCPIVVVDNASSDHSLGAVKENFPDVTALSMGKNAGFGAAVNAGARQLADVDLVLILNPDARLQPGQLEVMLRKFMLLENAAAMGVRLVGDDGHLQLSIGPKPHLSMELARKFIQQALDGQNRFVRMVLGFALHRRLRVPWVAGACLLVDRKAFKAIGGFDENFFLYFEDMDLCLRLTQAGLGDIYFEPGITVQHSGGASSEATPWIAQQAYRDSQVYFWEKHRGGLHAFVVKRYLAARGLLPEHRSPPHILPRQP